MTESISRDNSPERQKKPREVRRAITKGRHRSFPPDSYPSLHRHLLRDLPLIAGAVFVIALTGGIRYEYDIHQPLNELPDQHPYVQIDPSHEQIMGPAPEKVSQTVGSAPDAPSQE